MKPKKKRKTRAKTENEEKKVAKREEEEEETVKEVVGENGQSATHKDKKSLGEKKYGAYAPFVGVSPFPNYNKPTREECAAAHRILGELHDHEVKKEFEDEFTPETIPHVLDALLVGVLSQATGWSNAKRAMASLKATYGHLYAYDEIMAGGRDKLAEALRPGGLHVRKAMIITTILEQVRERHGKWDLDHMFDLSDEDAMKELLSYKYIGTKSASVVMGWSMKRNPFTVDTHVYRIAGLWEWRPKEASKEKTQSHLEVMIPPRYKFDLHFYFIQHGRACPACKGGSSRPRSECTAYGRIKELLKAGSVEA